jgi:hypothetical protein
MVVEALLPLDPELVEEEVVVVVNLDPVLVTVVVGTGVVLVVGVLNKRWRPRDCVSAAETQSCARKSRFFFAAHETQCLSATQI